MIWGNSYDATYTYLQVQIRRYCRRRRRRHLGAEYSLEEKLQFSL